jgi:hypothetical protein
MRGSPLRLPFPFLLTADGNLILSHTIPHVERVQKLLRLRRKGRRTLQVSLRHGQGTSLYTRPEGLSFLFSYIIQVVPPAEWKSRAADYPQRL